MEQLRARCRVNPAGQQQTSLGRLFNPGWPDAVGRYSVVMQWGGIV
jgi:hypothetical protein